MHSGPLPDTAGEFGEWKPTRAENPRYRCRECGSDDVWYRVWASHDGAYEDHQYECRGCGRHWWVESDDG